MTRIGVRPPAHTFDDGELFELDSTLANKLTNATPPFEGPNDIEYKVNAETNREVITSHIINKSSGRRDIRPPKHTWFDHGKDDNAVLYIPRTTWEHLLLKRSSTAREQKFYVLGIELEDELTVISPIILHETTGSHSSCSSTPDYERLIEAITAFDPRIALTFGHSHCLDGLSSGDIADMRKLSQHNIAFRNFIVVTPSTIKTYRMFPDNSKDIIPLTGTSFIQNHIPTKYICLVDPLKQIILASISYARKVIEIPISQ